jgi:hypothetical protein
MEGTTVKTNKEKDRSLIIKNRKVKRRYCTSIIFLRQKKA